MADGSSADRSAELLLWFHREPSRYLAEGRRRNAPHPESALVLKLALGRHVGFSDAALNDPRMSIPLKKAATAYIRNLYFHPDANPYQTLGLAPGASQEEIRENFRQLMQLVHPDRQGDRKDWPDACAAQANRAYAMLRDPDSRDRLEREAEARAALARAIYRAAATAEASQMPVSTWPKAKRGGKPFKGPMLPEWVTAGVGDYVRRNPAVSAFVLLLFGAGFFVIVSAWSGQDGMLVRGAREPRASAESLIAKAEPVRAAPATSAGAVAEVASARRPQASASNVGTVAVPTLANGRAVPPSEPRVTAVAAVPTPVPVIVAEPSVPAAVPVAAVIAPDPPSRMALAAPMPPPAAEVPTPRAVVPESRAENVALAPMSAAAGTSPPATAEIEALFAAFVETYERGRLDAFTALFDADADTNLRRGRSAIRAEYDELFRLSQWRRMQLTRVNWRRSGDRTIAKGEITVKIGWRDGREVEQRLNVDMELMRREGRVVIAKMTHEAKSP